MTEVGVEAFYRGYQEGPAVRGFLHAADGDSALVLTHGAGGNADSRLLVALAEAFAESGVSVLRSNMPFRQKRLKGPPNPGRTAQDREGLRRAVDCMRERAAEVYLGGQSYGGRQATMLASEDESVADALLLISYPLHPPGRPERSRTDHFDELRTPSLFVHGSKDPFGTLEEMRVALQRVSGRNRLLEIENGGHGLVRGKTEALYQDVAARIVTAFSELIQFAK